MVLLALTGCGSSRPVAAPSSSPAQLPPNEVSGVQIPAGRIDEAVAKVDGLVAELMKNSGIPGMAVAIVHGGKTLYAKGFGVKDAGKGDGPDNKVNADTVFQLASVSKSVGATVVAHEVTEGAITWDTPVATKLPGFTSSIPTSPRTSASPTCTRTARVCPITPATRSKTWATTGSRCWIG